MKILAVTSSLLALVLLAYPAQGACVLSHCKEKAAKPSRSYVRNNHRQIVGDLYDPGTGGRVQIRDTSRRIIGYIERDGTVTNTHRQKVGTLDR